LPRPEWLKRTPETSTRMCGGHRYAGCVHGSAQGFANKVETFDRLCVL
jgi:hypothetical protein